MAETDREYNIVTSRENRRNLTYMRGDNTPKIDPYTRDLTDSKGNVWAPSAGIGLPEEPVRQSNNRAIVPVSYFSLGLQQHQHQ